MMLLAIAFGVNISVFLCVVLSGSVVGFALCLFALSQGIRTELSSSLIFFGTAGAIIFWIFSSIILKITTITLYNTTGDIFGLFIGVVGATSTCLFFFDALKEKNAM